jgi:hypothetical protein
MCGYGLPYAQRYQNKFNDSTAELLIGPNHTGQKTCLRNQDLVIKTGSRKLLGYYQLNLSFVENEEDDDKAQFVKKYSDGASYFTFADGLPLGNNYDQHAENSSPANGLIYLPSSPKRFLFFRAFRL